MAILLQMAAAQQWGPDQWNRLDRLTVSLPHAEATIMLSAKTPTEITAHFSGPPQMYQQRRDPNLRMVLDSTSITGGPITQNAVWASREFVDKNPQLHGAVFAAIEEAMAFVNEQPLAATRTYLKAESWSLDPDEIAAGLKEPGVTFSIVPVRTMFFAEFMNRVGLIKQVPASWQELWVKDLHQRPGS
jgi:NitT/TauT family transport system substrate-binding protein